MSSAIKGVPIWIWRLLDTCLCLDYDLWITLHHPWTKSCVSQWNCRGWEETQAPTFSKVGEISLNFKLQSCKTCSVLYPTTAYVRQILTRTWCMFILYLFSGNFEHLLFEAGCSSLLVVYAKRTWRWQNQTFVSTGSWR